MRYNYTIILLMIFVSNSFLNGQSIISFDNQGWNSDQAVNSSFTIGELLFSGNKSFYTNYGYDFNTDNNSLYFVFEDPASDNITITTLNNELINLNSISAYQVSELSTNTLIIEGWNGSTKQYSKSFSNIVTWQQLPLNYLNINKLVIRSGSLTTGIADFNFDNISYEKSNINNFVRVKIKVFLQGPYTNSVMKTNLKDAGVLPLQQPYNTSPWNYAGDEKITSIPAGMVDWILVELKTGSSSSSVVKRNAVLLKSDGRVFDIDGIEGLRYDNLAPGNYYITVRHRNHLAIMSAAPVSFSVTSPEYDFTAAREKIYGVGGIVYLGNGIYGMYAGDADANGIVNESDYETVGKTLFQSGYKQGDLDFNQNVNVLDYEKIFKSLNKSTKVPN